ncbi:MAG: hypothetical protein Ct9H300mP16_10510 [Pseudomonadota bacterium]|nr:MAG: hypothetical protein Ct9H300mP16_10510 [Pseudomonadota bacterium]
MAALWWMDGSRAGAVLRAVGEDEVAAQSVGINLTASKSPRSRWVVLSPELGGGFTPTTPPILSRRIWEILLATFAIAYPLLGGLSNVFGTLLRSFSSRAFSPKRCASWGLAEPALRLLIVVAMNARPPGGSWTRICRAVFWVFSDAGQRGSRCLKFVNFPNTSAASRLWTTSISHRTRPDIWTHRAQRVR